MHPKATFRLNMELANNIKKVAREHGTNIKEISQQLGVLPNNLSRRINSPKLTMEDLEKIATAIGCEIEDFFLVDKLNKVYNFGCPRCGESLDISILLKISPSKKR